MLPVISQDVRDRMSFLVELDENETPIHRSPSGITGVDRPNYRFENIRLLLGANLEGDGPQLIQRLMGKIGATQTPIPQVLSELRMYSCLCSTWVRRIRRRSTLRQSGHPRSTRGRADP